MFYASKVAMCRAEIPKLAYDNNTLEVQTNCGPDNDLNSPKEARWSAALGKLLVANPVYSHIRSIDLGFTSKRTSGSPAVQYGIDSDPDFIWYTSASYIHRENVAISGPYLNVGSININSIRMISAQPTNHIIVTSNNATAGHGIYLVRKSDMTVVASILATGTGDNQFTNPLGVFYVGGYAYICDSTRIIKIAVNDTLGTLTWDSSVAIVANDLCFDGTNWFVQSATQTIKYDAVFTDATKVATACVGYSITIIPDQSDGNGATLGIVNNTGNCLYRLKCSDLSQIATVGSAGTGAASLCDLNITGAAGNYQTNEGDNIAAASGSTPTKNGLTGLFFRGTGGNRVTFRPTGGNSLRDITAIDFNDDQISGEIKNLYKCVNLTSCKLQTNPALVLDLGRLSAKMQTLWAYACGAGISSSIRHMTAATSINLRENGASQAQVDQWIDDLWQNRDVMTPGAANFNGSNAAPSGIYQDATPPTTGKEKAYDLIENYGWNVAITL